jgi:hypothetical protein
MKRRIDFQASFSALGRRVCAAALMMISLCSQQVVEASPQDPLDTWHIRQPPTFPTEEQFEGVAYGNGRWVIVGGDGTILSSPDGVEWTAETNPTATRLNDVVDLEYL